MIASPADLRRVTGADFTVSDQQWRAISAPLEPAVVIAGAGSGKTELMSARVIYLVANGLVRPDQVLGLTFTTKATAELGDRVRRALRGAGLETSITTDDGEIVEQLEPTVLTYNAYGAGLLADHGLRIGHEADLRVMAEASRFQLAQRVVAQHSQVVQRLSDHPATVITNLLALDGAMSEHLVGIDDVLSFQEGERPIFEASLQRLIGEGGRTKGKQDVLGKVLEVMAQRVELLGLVADYRGLKAQWGLIDFSDQIAGAHRLATEHPQVGALERDRFRVVLLDEYQDTSVAQARLLAGLFADAGHAVMAVGDPNQAIYGWRGASVANIARFPEQFPRSDQQPAAVFNLTVNRRSDAAVLAVANALAQPLYDDPTMPVEPLEPKPGAEAGRVRAVRHRTHDDELRWVAEEITAAHDRGVSWREIGVLVRTNKHGAEAYDVFAEAGIPVEIVGLGGLIRLPEVAQVVATLSLLEDLTDNAALLTLLTGPRWEIGVRDLALLGQRSAELAHTEASGESGASLIEQLQLTVSGADPTELASLCEALECPGELPYSAEAKARFSVLADELRHLRTFTSEPLLDLLRRITDVSGLDVELASSTSPAAAARRENLDLFVQAVADFQAVDGSVSLAALNAWLETEDDYGGGLDLAAPSESDAVKLLTIHRAKGLEYDLVFLLGVGEKKFPNTTLRPQWTTAASVLPSPLRGDRDHVPQARGYSSDDIAKVVGSLEDQARAHQAAEELRLGYVAFTRARHDFVVSSHAWAPSPLKEIPPSPYQVTLAEHLRALGQEEMLKPWYLAPGQEKNPHEQDPPTYPWPDPTHDEERLRRESAAEMVRAAGGEDQDPADLDPSHRRVLEAWDSEIDRLIAEAQESESSVIEVSLPASLSATSWARLRLDPEAFARDLARPVPRRPVPQARFGTRFHAWVESRFGQQQLLDPDELSGRADVGIEDDTDLVHLQQTFASGQFGERTPVAVEPPFSLVLGGHLIRGRIDAVYADGDDWLVVDWKTSRRHDADPLQLAIYRLAWAELQGVPLHRVRAGFHYVRTDTFVEPEQLAMREELEELIAELG